MDTEPIWSWYVHIYSVRFGDFRLVVFRTVEAPTGENLLVEISSGAARVHNILLRCLPSEMIKSIIYSYGMLLPFKILPVLSLLKANLWNDNLFTTMDSYLWLVKGLNCMKWSHPVFHPKLGCPLFTTFPNVFCGLWFWAFKCFLILYQNVLRWNAGFGASLQTHLHEKKWLWLFLIDVLFPLVGWLIEGLLYPFNNR